MKRGRGKKGKEQKKKKYSGREIKDVRENTNEK